MVKFRTQLSSLESFPRGKFVYPGQIEAGKIFAAQFSKHEHFRDRKINAIRRKLKKFRLVLVLLAAFGEVVKGMAHEVVRIVCRCDEANETLHLDLSECELMQVPDAVYHLMRNTELKTCDLSSNVITKIPAKIAIKFSLITDLNISHNHISKLPDELADLGSLQRLDISHNSFIVLPPVVFKMPQLQQLLANNNEIIEIDTDQMILSDSLELVDLRNNPLARQCHKKLKNAKVGFRVELSEWMEQDW